MSTNVIEYYDIIECQQVEKIPDGGSRDTECMVSVGLRYNIDAVNVS